MEAIMAITRYEPLSWLNQLQGELERAPIWGASEGSVATAAWAPAVDIKEEQDKFILHADLPGVKPEETDVSMENGVLTIKGEKKSEAITEKDGYKRVERTYGSFHRRFSLPDTANPDAISAKSKNGVLEIIIPKRESVQPKKIAVATVE
jgi:HSP20 family protein